MSKKLLTGADLNNQRITSLADPTAATDAATKQYIDNRVDGLNYKGAVRAATTTNGTLVSAYANGSSIDGVTLATNDRILIKDQTTQAENGIYVVQASGAPVRASDANTTVELNNATVYVTSGTVNAGREYTQTTANPTIGSSNIVFAQKASGTSYSFTAPLINTSGTVSINSIGNGLIGDGTSLRVDPAVVVRKYAVNCAATTTTTVTHNLGTLDVVTAIITVSGGELVEADVLITGVNTLTVTFATAPTAGQYRIVVQG
jgi:hypothetical protein